MVSVSEWLTVAFTFIHWGGALDSSHLHLQALEEVTFTFKWEINRFASHFLYNLFIYSPKPDFGSPKAKANCRKETNVTHNVYQGGRRQGIHCVLSKTRLRTTPSAWSSPIWVIRNTHDELQDAGKITAVIQAAHSSDREQEQLKSGKLSTKAKVLPGQSGQTTGS